MANGRNSAVVYTVEARTSYPSPQTYAGMILHGEWQRVNFNNSVHAGVPNHTFCRNAGPNGYLTYEAAEALRWWFMSSEALGLCIETRLVAHDFEETWSCKRKSVSPATKMPRRPWDEFTPESSEAKQEKPA